MRRSKSSDSGRKPAPVGSWLAGAMIGATIMTMATGALVLGASLAVNRPERESG